MSTDAVDVEISKQVSQDLSRLAPDVEAMLSNFNINLNTMKALLLEQLVAGWVARGCLHVASSKRAHVEAMDSR